MGAEMKVFLALAIALTLSTGIGYSAFCCKDNVTLEDRCYVSGSGQCCGGIFYADSCHNFTIRVYGPGNYIVAEPTELIVEIDNTGLYGDSYELSAVVVDRAGLPSPNSHLIIVNMDAADELDVAAGATGFTRPQVTVLAANLVTDCINITAHSVGADMNKTAVTCIDSVDVSLSLDEFQFIGLVLMMLIAPIIIITKFKRG
ncbi:hypothetical protein A3K63_03635 [Candidatus Micrarchaeota archaeon RBG_16_49_10]|nr:MAG: hypothetical protein A3K63_03635 [Candidatus Micrarchaeota archaeon RBG_16_49_10]